MSKLPTCVKVVGPNNIAAIDGAGDCNQVSCNVHGDICDMAGCVPEIFANIYITAFGESLYFYTREILWSNIHEEDM